MLSRLFKNSVVICFAVSCWITPAAAQSACSYIAYGAVLTAAQWNQCFASKQDTLGYAPVNKAGDVMLGKLVMSASTSISTGLNLPQGAAPTNPNNGDVWTTISGLFVRINGLTIGPLAGANSNAFAATSPIAVTFPSGVVTYALNKDANFSTVGGALSLATGGIAYPSAVTGGAKGAGTINASGLYVNGTAVNAAGITALTGDVVATGPGSVTATIQANVVSYAKFQQVASASIVGNPTGGLANAQGVTLGSTLLFSASSLQTGAGTGDVSWSANSFSTTLATVNSDVGNFGNSTAIPTFTVNGKGLLTAAGTAAVIAPAGTLTGTTLAANIVSSSLTTVGALGAGSATTGFTINAGNVTWSGQVPGANVAVAANASGAPSATFGVMKCDGITITCLSGVITSVGSVATSIQVGTTSITSGTSTRVLFNNAGVLGEYSVSGTGNVALTTGPSFTGMSVAGTANFTGTFQYGGNTQTFPASAATLSQTVFSGTAAMGTGAITSGTCATVVTVSATGVATTDVVLADFNGDPTAVTGYAPTTNGMLTVISYPTANNVNFKVCNNTSASITPGAITLNVRVIR